MVNNKTHLGTAQLILFKSFLNVDLGRHRPGDVGFGEFDELVGKVVGGHQRVRNAKRFLWREKDKLE